MRKLPRPRIQRAFARWLYANEARFAVPLNVRYRKSWVAISIQRLNPCIAISLTHVFNIGVWWNGGFWDFLIWIDACPTHTPQGYIDEHTIPEFREFYPSRDALWTELLFEPFLVWVNEELVPARWLALYALSQDSSGGKWVKLSKQQKHDAPEGDAIAWLPLWIGP